MKSRILTKLRSNILCLITGLILGAYIFGGTVAYAANDFDTAVNYLAQQGIYKGDNKGNLNLDKGLTRAELAVILTRLDFADAPNEWADWGEARFSNPEHRYNTFTDIPSWALPYIEYCYQLGYMKGATATRFDPQGAVNPKMACTVMLRYCGIADTEWSYDTSVTKAQSIGIAPVDGMSGDAILRGTIAVIIYRSIQYAETGSLPSDATTAAPTPSHPVTPTPSESANMTINEMRMEIVRLTNIERVKAGVPELEIMPELMDCAQAKAQDMKDNDYYDHYSPIYGSSGDMIRSFVPVFVGQSGENIISIAPWSNVTQHIMDGWMRSSGHRGNMLIAEYTHIGVGLVMDSKGGYYCVQQFISP